MPSRLRKKRIQWCCLGLGMLLLGGGTLAHAQQEEVSCCMGQDCVVVPRETCLGQGGTPLPAGTTCSSVPDPCEPSTVIVACCKDGGCAMLPSQQCVAGGGTPLPAGVTCEDKPCERRSCCVQGICVDNVYPEDCIAHGGQVLPPGVPCNPDDTCPTPECRVSRDGKSCSQTGCPNSTQKCRPRCVSYRPDAPGEYQILDCDCVGQDRCFIQLPAPGTVGEPTCAGQCPPGFKCQTRKTVTADGFIILCCDCVPDPKPCRPNAERTACEGGCPPGSPGQCRPSKVHIGPNNQITVEECECLNPETCRPVTSPTAGVDCQGPCPGGGKCERVVTPDPTGAGFSLECRCHPCDPALCDDQNPCTKDYCDPLTGQCRHDLISCDDGNACTQDVCVPGPNGQPMCVHAIQLCFDGDPCTDDRCDPHTGQCVFTPRNCDDGDPCTKDFCDPNTGECRHAPDPACDQACCIDGQCLMMPADDCLHKGGTVFPGVNCADDPNPCERRSCCVNGVCNDNVLPQHCKEIGGQVLPPGVLCGPNHTCPTPECRPAEDGKSCSQTLCPAGTNLKCRPRCVAWRPDVVPPDFRILDCDCMNENRCYIELPQPGTTGGPQCAGQCPPGFRCETKVTTTPDGLIVMCCECVPDEPVCRVNITRTGCEGQCPPNADGTVSECRPSKVVVGPNGQIEVEECSCQQPEACHLVPGDFLPGCAGPCPAGSGDCTRVVTQDAAGTHVQCRCHPCDPAKCDDGNACTKDYCDPLTGQCRHDPINCDDGNACTEDRCISTPNGPQCIHILKVCDDNNACTFDRCNPQTGECVYIPKDCDDGDDCTIDRCDPKTGECTHVPNPDCQACCLPDGTCEQLLPSMCQQKGGQPKGPGTDCTTADICPQPNECIPSLDGQRCRPAECPNPNQRCAPRCVRFDPATGRFRVEQCECSHVEQCHVNLPQPTPDDHQTGCIVPDSGAGTIDFPPKPCAYRADAGGSMMIVDGLPPGTSIRIMPTLDSFFDVFVGDLGDGSQNQNWKAFLDVPMHGMGGLAGFNRHMDFMVMGGTHTAPRVAGPLQSFETELLQLQGQLPPGDPDFDLLRITAGSNFGLPSPGHTTLVQLPGGNWAVDSFFDITYRIDFVGAPGGKLAGMSGSTTGTVRMRAGAPPPDCVGICPPGQVCHREVVANADGTYTICCKCEEPPPPDCRPTPDQRACAPAECPPGQKCEPTKVRLIPGTTEVIVLECECRGENDCHAAPGPAGPTCVGGCPNPVEACQSLTTTNNDGTVDIECRCQCDPAKCDDGNPCTEDRCHPDTGECIHVPKNCDDGDPCTIDSCDPQTGECRHVPDPLCQACCFPSGAPCQNLPANRCQELGGQPQGPGSNCSNVDCHNEPQTPKFSQPVSPEREDIASNINFNAPTLVNKLVTDDFRSDGRPITSVVWWGSYLDPAFSPDPPSGVVPKRMDGFLISFHLPLGPKPTVAQPALGVYFAPIEAVRIVKDDAAPCDQHPVYKYKVDLSKCRLVDSNPDPRVPTADPCRCPAKPEFFCERYCYRYSLGIQAVVGRRWAHAAAANCCIPQPNNNFAEGDFWGWHTTNLERDARPALESRLSLATAEPNQCPLGECPPANTEFRYGPWQPAREVCPFPHRINMAFELWTNVFQVPPACPKLVLVSATSIKRHGTVGTFGINLPLTAVADAAVEPRLGGPTLIELKFNQPIAAGDGSVEPGDEVTVNVGTIVSLAISGDTLLVELKDVPNRSCLLLTVENGPDGITTLGHDPLEGDNDVRVRVLFADVNGSGAVNAGDIGLVKSQSLKPVDATNFRMDVNANGAINAGDIGQVKAVSLTTVTCP